MPPSVQHGFGMIVPGSRGLGLALARKVLMTTHLPLVVTARESNLTEVRSRIMKDLHGVDTDRLIVARLDVTDEKSMKDVASQVRETFRDRRLQLFLSSAGILHPERAPKDLVYANIVNTFHVNTIGPLLLIKYFSEFLARKSDPPFASEPSLPSFAIWSCMSARVGSIADNSLGGWYSYRSSKAALNSIIKTFDIHLQRTSENHAVVIGMHPGTVKTDFSKEFWEGIQRNGVLFEPVDAASNLMSVIKTLRLEQRGRIWDWKGEEISP